LVKSFYDISMKNQGYPPILERLIDKIIPQDGCWGWTGSIHSGRPGISVGKKSRIASRVMYEIAYGPIPDGMLVCHTCDNPTCLRPTHFFLGTIQDNSADMVKKGRSFKPKGELHPMHKLSEERVRQIKICLKRRMEQAKIAKRFNVSRALITLIKQRKVWSHID